MTPQQDELARVIRQAHHLGRAKHWLDHALAAAAFGVPLALVGLFGGGPTLMNAGGVLCIASWVCSRVSDYHCRLAKAQ